MKVSYFICSILCVLIFSSCNRYKEISEYKVLEKEIESNIQMLRCLTDETYILFENKKIDYGEATYYMKIAKTIDSATYEVTNFIDSAILLINPLSNRKLHYWFSKNKSGEIIFDHSYGTELAKKIDSFYSFIENQIKNSYLQPHIDDNYLKEIAYPAKIKDAENWINYMFRNKNNYECILILKKLKQDFLTIDNYWALNLFESVGALDFIFRCYMPRIIYNNANYYGTFLVKQYDTAFVDISLFSYKLKQSARLYINGDVKGFNDTDLIYEFPTKEIGKHSYQCEMHLDCPENTEIKKFRFEYKVSEMKK